MPNHQTKQKQTLFTLSDQAKHDLLEELFYFLSDEKIDKRIELFHQWLLGYISTSNEPPNMDVLLQYKQVRELLTNIKAIKKMYRINFSV